MPPVPACVGFSQDRMTLEMHTHTPMFREKRHISCTVFAQWNDVGFLWDPQPRNSAAAFTFPNGDSWSCFKGTDQCFGWFICQHYPCTNGHLLFNYQSQLFWDPVQVSLPQNSPHTLETTTLESSLLLWNKFLFLSFVKSPPLRDGILLRVHLDFLCKAIPIP